MSDLSNSIKELKFDKRMISWNKRQKLLNDQEYKDHIKNLKDCSDLKYDASEEQA